MRCRLCGAESQVLETRSDKALFLLRRRRRCFNNHPFSTVEIHTTIFSSLGNSKYRELAAALLVRVQRYARNLQILKAKKAGKSNREIGREYGIKETAVRNALRRVSNHGNN